MIEALVSSVECREGFETVDFTALDGFLSEGVLWDASGASAFVEGFMVRNHSPSGEAVLEKVLCMYESPSTRSLSRLSF